MGFLDHEAIKGHQERLVIQVYQVSTDPWGPKAHQDSQGQVENQVLRDRKDQREPQDSLAFLD